MYDRMVRRYWLQSEPKPRRCEFVQDLSGISVICPFYRLILHKKAPDCSEAEIKNHTTFRITN